MMVRKYLDQSWLDVWEGTQMSMCIKEKMHVVVVVWVGNFCRDCFVKGHMRQEGWGIGALWPNHWCIMKLSFVEVCITMRQFIVCNTSYWILKFCNIISYPIIKVIMNFTRVYRFPSQTVIEFTHIREEIQKTIVILTNFGNKYKVKSKSWNE